jgi:phosphoribosylformylglycinamidine synthase
MVDSERTRHAWSLFAENQARYVVTEPFDQQIVEKLANEAGVGCCYIGWTGGETIAVCRGEDPVYPEVPLDTLRSAHESFFKDWMEG